MNSATIWRTTLAQLDMTPIDALTKTWLKDAHLMELAQDISDELSPNEPGQGIAFLLQVPNDLAYDVITTRWQHLLEDVLQRVIGQPVALAVQSSDHADEAVPEQIKHLSEREREIQSSRVNAPIRRQQPYPQQHAQNSNAYYEDEPPAPSQTEFSYASTNTLEDWENEQRANMLAHNRLNHRYTFDAFIVGNSNRLAHARLARGCRSTR